MFWICCLMKYLKLKFCGTKHGSGLHGWLACAVHWQMDILTIGIGYLFMVNICQHAQSFWLSLTFVIRHSLWQLSFLSITGGPARSVAVLVLRLLSDPKMLQQGWHVALINGRSTPIPNFTFIGAEMWEYSPKTIKIWNFAHIFAPHQWLICIISTNFSAFVCIYR